VAGFPGIRISAPHRPRSRVARPDWRVLGHNAITYLSKLLNEEPMRAIHCGDEEYQRPNIVGQMGNKKTSMRTKDRPSRGHSLASAAVQSYLISRTHMRPWSVAVLVSCCLALSHPPRPIASHGGFHKGSSWKVCRKRPGILTGHRVPPRGLLAR